MPKEVFGPGYQFMRRDDLLTFEEIRRLAGIFVDQGVRKIRLTGGEHCVLEERHHSVGLGLFSFGLQPLLVGDPFLLVRFEQSPSRPNYAGQQDDQHETGGDHLHPVATNEFQRADCSPRGTKGDGVLAVDDFTQAGRYAAGLDQSQRAGGPTQFSGFLSKPFDLGQTTVKCR